MGAKSEQIESRAATGDADAFFALASCRLQGVDGPQDLSAAHTLLRKAAGKGHAGAARMRAHLVAAGVGCRADPEEARRLLGKIAHRDARAAAQIDLLKRVANVTKPRRHLVNESPQLILVEQLLAPEECRYLIAIAEPRVEPSHVGHAHVGPRARDSIRTSHEAGFGPGDEDLVMNRINRRIAAATGTRYECGEPLHILRYTPGQEYKPHLDTIVGAANQREWTAIVYLNSGYKGGETDFPLLDIRAEGAAGDALLFRSLDDEGRPDPRTRHAGLPVTSGTKWIASRWIRQARHDPWEEMRDLMGPT